jgi:hypothetical protein
VSMPRSKHLWMESLLATTTQTDGCTYWLQVASRALNSCHLLVLPSARMGVTQSRATVSKDHAARGRSQHTVCEVHGKDQPEATTLSIA